MEFFKKTELEAVTTGLTQGYWNASTNTPDLTVSGITTGYMWCVSVSGNTVLDDNIKVWNVGDWAVKINDGWGKVIYDVTGSSGNTLIIPNLNISYNFKVNLIQDTTGIGFFDADTVNGDYEQVVDEKIVYGPNVKIPEYAVLVSMDGARYSDTWETPERIPNIISIANAGFANSNLYTIEPSTTIPGHVAMSTGYFDPTVNNSGTVNPTYPTFLQEWLHNKGIVSTGGTITCSGSTGFTNMAKMIFSKDKLYSIGGTTGIYNEYLPYINAGVNCDGTGGYREDSITHDLFLSECLGETPPYVSMVSYAEPDTYAHAGNWTGYTTAITQTDTYIGEIWNIIQSHPLMKDNTTLIITNDHGRQTPNWEDHGGSTDSECHVLFVAIGPNILNTKSSTYRRLDNIPITLLKSLNIDKVYSSGTTMNEMLLTYIVTGSSQSRLVELRKYTITTVFAEQYVINGSIENDGVDLYPSNPDSSIVYFLGGIRFVDTILSGVTVSTTFSFKPTVFTNNVISYTGATTINESPAYTAITTTYKVNDGALQNAGTSIYTTTGVTVYSEGGVTLKLTGNTIKSYYSGVTVYSDTGFTTNNPNFITFPNVSGGSYLINGGYYKNPNKENIISNPKIYDDVFIDREELSAFDNNYRLEFVRNLIDLETYAGGNYFNVVSNT